MVVCHLQYYVWYLLYSIKALKVIGTVHKNLVAGTVTIMWMYIPPLLCNTERLGAIYQSKGVTQDWILDFRWGSISLTLWDISKYYINISFVRISLHLRNRQLRLEDGPWFDPWCRGSIGTNLPQYIASFLYLSNPFFDWYN